MADILTKWKNGLERTRKSTFGKIATLFGTSEITSETWDDLEAMLIQADVGIETVDGIIRQMRNLANEQGIITVLEIKQALVEELKADSIHLRRCCSMLANQR